MIIRHSSSSNLPYSAGLRCVAFCICMLLSATAKAQSATNNSSTTEASPERAIDRAELLDHMDEVRRQYPALYDRLRRGPKTSATAEMSVTDQSNPTAIPVVQPTRSIETLLNQEVKVKKKAKTDASLNPGGNP